MRREKDQIGTLKFIAIGVMLMLLVDHFVFDGKRSYIEELRTKPVVEAAKPPPVRVEPPDGKEYFEAPVEEILEEKKSPPSIAPLPSPRVRGDKGGSVNVTGSPKIAIIIDDIGMDIKRSKQAIDLPAPITLALLPYAPKVREMAVEAKAKGHALIIHTPMEAEDAALNIGPGGLKSSMSVEELDAAFGKMLASFDGYEGINNHMGSRLTQNETVMARIMGKLAEKKLFFVDSKTSGKSVAGAEAAEAGISFASRDVFLDHTDSAAGVAAALNHTVELAQRRGYAIAIGHPKDHTIAALKAWIPTLEAKGIALVPVRELLVKSSPQRGEDLGEGEQGLRPLTTALSPEERGSEAAVPTPPEDMFPEGIATGVTVTSEPAPPIQLRPPQPQSPLP